MFGGWFSAPSVNNQAHENFHVSLKQLLDELSKILEDLHTLEPDTCDQIALAAAEIILASNTKGNKTPEQWFMLACEGELMILLKYFGKNSLEVIRDRILSVTPKRMLFPNQKAFLEAVENQLKTKNSDI